MKLIEVTYGKVRNEICIELELSEPQSERQIVHNVMGKMTGVTIEDVYAVIINMVSDDELVVAEAVNFTTTIAHIRRSNALKSAKNDDDVRLCGMDL